MSIDDVCEAAEEEGQLVSWLNAAFPEKLFEGFMSDYPGIEVEWTSMGDTEQVQRVLTEHTAGRTPTPDTIIGEPNNILVLRDQGAIDTSVDWAALGVSDEVVHPTLNVPRHARVALGIVYNTDVHEAGDLPDTWEGLLDEQWEGQIVVDPRGRPFDALSLAWGHDATIDYVQRLNESSPVIIEGGTAGMLAVASGQAAITTGGRSAETFEQQAEGTPLEIKYLDVIPVNDSYTIPVANARHPNAAKCYAAWIATERGQSVYYEAEFKSNDSQPEGAPTDAEFIAIENADDAAAVAEISEEIGQIFTGTAP